MVILHIASLWDNPFSGVTVVVPEHVKAQGRTETAALLNITNESIAGVEALTYKKPFRLEELPRPFNRPDLAVFHEAYRVDYLAMAVQLKKAGIPYIIIPHGELGKTAQKKKWIKKKAANLLMFGSFIRGALAIQCLSEQEKENTTMGRHKFVGTNGIAIPAIQKESFREENTRFVYIGRLDAYHKGLDLMLEAVRLSGELFRKAGCWLDIYGPDGAGRLALLQKMVQEKQIGDLVRLHPPITGEEKQQALLDGDIFIQTSRFEGMPMGILEALSCGVPCLVTHGTNLGEQIEREDAGWVAETEARSIAFMMKKAIEERSLWADKGKKARTLAAEEFGWPSVAACAVKEYKRRMSKI